MVIDCIVYLSLDSGSYGSDKGQKISEAHCLVLISSKKRTKYLPNSALKTFYRAELGK